jgi:hypothetical protein
MCGGYVIGVLGFMVFVSVGALSAISLFII